MALRKLTLISGLVALAAAVAPPTALASEPHAHGVHASIQLNQGKKWATDDALRRGMSEMRSVMSAAIEPIHRKAYSASDYRSLAARLQDKVDYITANCKLPEAADQQLHLVLERVLDGISGLQSDAEGSQAATKLVEALDVYGTHFDHPGWVPLRH